MTLTPDQREALRQKVMAEMSRRMPIISKRFNDWRDWPGTWAFADVAVAALDELAAGVRADGEVISIDNDGNAICWNAETKQPYNSGEPPTDEERAARGVALPATASEAHRLADEFYQGIAEKDWPAWAQEAVVILERAAARGVSPSDNKTKR